MLINEGFPLISIAENLQNKIVFDKYNFRIFQNKKIFLSFKDISEGYSFDNNHLSYLSLSTPAQLHIRDGGS